jgi:sec-independent protein translocase protein TatB
LFGLSFFEVVVIAIVALLAVGPRRLPGMLRDLGTWLRKLRKMTTDVRAQTGIDDILRAEGLHGGLTELRSLMRGGAPAPAPAPYQPPQNPYADIDIDVSREYPPEGADAKGAIPDDLVQETPMDERPSEPKVARVS